MYACMYVYFFPWRYSPKWARPSSLSRLHDYTQTHHIQLNSSGRMVIPKQRPLPDKTQTQHSQETDILAPGGIRTLNRSKRAVVDPRLRPRGHSRIYCLHIYIYMYGVYAYYLLACDCVTFSVLCTRKQKLWKGCSINTDLFLPLLY